MVMVLVKKVVISIRPKRSGIEYRVGTMVGIEVDAGGEGDSCVGIIGMVKRSQPVDGTRPGVIDDKGAKMQDP